MQDEIEAIPDGRAQIIVLHLYCELFLEELIKAKVEKPNEIDFEKWNFPRKHELAYAMGLVDKTMNEDMKKLNSIRNQYAHNLQPNMSKVEKELRNLSNYPPEKIAKKLSEYARLRYAIYENLDLLLTHWWKIKGKLDFMATKN